MQRISLRSFLIALLGILIVMTLALLYLYYIISRPPNVPAYQTSQIKNLFSIYGYGTKNEEMLDHPSDVAFDGDGNIYIADTGHARVLLFRSNGQYIRTLGKKGSGKGELMEPLGVTVSKDDRVYIADHALNKVVIYNRDGKFEGEFKVMMPFKPYVANDKLYLTTYGHVIIYDLNGQQLTQWAHKGRQKGDLDSPVGIAVAPDGKIYVADTFNLRLQAFAKDGEVLWVKGKPAEDVMARDRAFGLPCGLVMDKKKLLYLVDAFDDSIRVLDTNGKQLAELSKKGSREGEFDMPMGIAYDQNGVFAIADKYNNRVQIVKITVK